jgi:chromosome segregation ATPase
MRTVIALLFAFFAVSAFAAQENKFGQAFKMLAQFANSDEADEVLEVLQNVAGEIQEIIDHTQSQYDDQEEAAQEAFAGYKANIDDLSSQLELVKSQWEADQDIAEDLQSQIDEELSIIQQADQALGDEQSRRANAHAAFSSNYDAIQGAIDAAQEALNLIKIITDNDNTATMMELTHKKLGKAFKHIHHTIETLSMRKTLSSMASVLLEVAQNGVNEDAIDQINDLINALIDTLNDELDIAVQAENDDAAYSAQACDTLQNTIDNATDAANDNQEYLDSVVAEMNDLASAASNLQSTLDAATEARDNLIANWVSTSANFDALLARLHADMDALAEAETFLA